MAKIFGFEIKRSLTAAEPNPGVPSAGPNPVSLERANQKTLPSIPLQRSFPRAELGDSGTRTLHGIITEEYNSQLQGIQGIRVFDEMRKSDGTIRAAVLVCTLPIRRAQWFVNPIVDEDPVQSEKNQEIANFVEHALFDWMDIVWDDFIRQALLMVSFGVMVFEKVYGVVEHEGKQYVTVTKMAPRLPKSILQWELPDRTFGIQQIRQDGVLAMIPGSKMLIFVNEREGDNWWGTSMLRAAYKHYYYKNTFYHIDGVAFERQGMGVPMIEMPAGYTAADEVKAQTAAQNLRGNQNAYMVVPPGYKASFMDMGGKTTRDPATSIQHHDKAILQSVLAQFLELGASKASSGSRALSQDHSDLFLKAMESIANILSGVVNKDLIKELVDLNFDDVKVYPQLDFSGITKVDITALGTAYSQLVTAGALTPTEDDQQYIRAALGLPPRTQEQIDAEAEGDPSAEEQDESDSNIDDIPAEDENGDPVEPDENEPVDKNTPPTKTPSGKPVQKKAPNTPAGKNAKVDKAAKDAKKQAPTKQENAKTDAGAKKLPPKKNAHEYAGTMLRRFDDGSGFMSWRPLTFAEQKVNFQDIEDTMDSMQDSFSAEAKALLQKEKDTFMAKLHDAVAAGDQKAIDSLEMGFVADYAALVNDAMKSAYEYGKNNVSKEMGIKVPPSTADTLANIKLLSNTVATKTASDLVSKAKVAAVNSLNQNQSSYETSAGIDSTLNDAIDSAVTNTAGLLINQGINMGRNDVFERNASDIYALQRSEVLDERTCDFCLSMDGLTISPDDDWAATDSFHTNCRGIWVEIMNDEQNPPEITGVPDNVGNYYGGQPNQLIQPKAPIVQPNSPAAAEAQRRKDAKSK